MRCCALLLIVDATVYVGGLDEKVSEAILWELFLQAGPVGEKREREREREQLKISTVVCCTSAFSNQSMSMFLEIASHNHTRGMALWSSWEKRMQTTPSRS